MTISTNFPINPPFTPSILSFNAQTSNSQVLEIETAILEGKCTDAIALASSIPAEPSSQFFTTVSKLLQWICDKSYPNDQEQKLISLYLESGLLPIFLTSEGFSVLIEINANIRKGTLILNAELTSKLNRIEKILPLREIERLFRFVKRINYAKDFRNILSLYQVINHSLGELRRCDYPHFEIIYRIVCDSMQKPLPLIKSYEIAVAALKNGSPFKLEKEICVHLIIPLLDTDDWHQLSRIMTANTSRTQAEQTNSLFKHLMLDKLKFAQSRKYEGISLHLPAHTLIDTLNSLNIRELPQIEALREKVIPLLQQFIIFTVYRSFVNGLSCYVASKLKDLQIGQSILIPTGTEDHATAVLISRTDEASVNIFLYNTGEGIKRHPRWHRSNNMQTHIGFSGVPISTILDQTHWDALFNKSSASSDEEQMYSTFESILCKGGTQLPASSYEEDYEQPQYSGTCAMHCLMAFLRHQALEIQEGSPEEKEAFYKCVKTHLLLSFYEQHQSEVDVTIQKQLETPLDKLKGEMILIQAAADPSAYMEALAAHQALHHPSNDMPRSTFLSRYASLRKAAISLANACYKGEVSEAQLQNNAFLQLAAAKYKHHCLIFSYLAMQIKNNCFDSEFCLYILMKILLTPFMRKQGTKVAIEYLLEETMVPYPKTVRLFEVLSSYTPIFETVKIEIIEGLQLKDKCFSIRKSFVSAIKDHCS